MSGIQEAGQKTLAGRFGTDALPTAHPDVLYRGATPGEQNLEKAPLQGPLLQIYDTMGALATVGAVPMVEQNESKHKTANPRSHLKKECASIDNLKQ